MPSVLFLVSTNSPLGGVDQTISDILTGAGWTVTTQTFSSAANTDADGKDCVLVSDQGNSLSISSLFFDYGVPLVIWEYGLGDDYNFGTASDRTTGTQTDTEVMDNSHYITSAFSTGNLVVSSPAVRHSYVTGTGSGAEILTRIDSGGAGTGDPSLVVYESGATMANSTTAAERRVYLYFTTDGNFTTDGENLFMRAMDWAAYNTGGGSDYSLTASEIASTTTLDTPALSQTHSLAGAEIASTTTLDTPTLTTNMVTLNPTEDAHVDKGSPDTVFGSNTTLICRYHGGSVSRMVYLKFDLTGYTNIDSATLRLYGSVASTVPVAVFPCSNTSWDDGTITFNNQPGWEPGIMDVTEVSTAAYYEWDVSEYCYANENGVLSIAVYPTPADSTQITFNSVDNASNKPELVITYGGGAAAPAGLPINPWLKGYGVEFQAAEWDVYKVTNTATSGAGSFADAVSGSQRIIVFETSGTIDIDELPIHSANLYIAGQTAPAPGVLLKGRLSNISGANVIFSHISILTDYTTAVDTVTVGDTTTYNNLQTRVVFENCWIAFGADESVGLWNKYGDFHFQNCVIGPGSDSQGNTYGALFGGDATIGANFRVSLDKCLFIHNAERNPLAKTDIVTINNCIVYNGGDPHRTYISSREPTHTCNANVTGCLWIDGNGTTTGNLPIVLDATGWVSGSQVWVDGNAWEGNTVTTQWTDLVEVNGVTGAQAGAAIDWPTGLTTIAVDTLEREILARVGPFPGNRFTELAGYINELATRTGNYVTGGPGTIPTLTENTTSHTVPSNTTYEASGYTSAEEWLHGLALELLPVVPENLSSSVSLDTPALTENAGGSDYSLTANELSSATTLDTPAITQAHDLTAVEIASTSGVDTPAITQAHSITAPDLSATGTIETPALSQVSNLGGVDLASTSTLDTPALSQIHSLGVSDLASASTIDSPVITQVHNMSGVDLASTSTIDTPALTESGSLNADDLSSTVSIDTPAITQVHNLTGADIASTTTLDTPALTENAGNYSLTADDIAAGATLDTPAITQVHGLGTADLSSTGTIDSPAISQVHTLGAADLSSTSGIETPALSVSAVLAAVALSIATTTDTPALTQVHNLSGSELSISVVFDSAEMLGGAYTVQVGGGAIKKRKIMISGIGTNAGIDSKIKRR